MPVLKKHPGAGNIPTPAQTLAIEHASGPIQVLAGPGSGKTYLTIRRIRHLICHHGISPNKILVITFTKAAALEMEERFIHLTKGQYHEVTFGTFHAIFYHILQQSGYEGKKLTPISATDKWKILNHILKTHGIDNIDKELTAALIKEISEWKNSGKEPQGLFIIRDDVRKILPIICREYDEILKEENQLDFDDMICLCQKLLEQDARLCNYWQHAYSHILVDEFQDISPKQYQVLKKIALPENHLFVVGDDDQSIYGFRGAGPDIMRQFLADYPHAVQVVLEQNYRSTQAIVNASLILINDNQNRFIKQIRTTSTSDEKVILHAFETEEEEQQYLLGKIQKVSPKQLTETAIICRTNLQLSKWTRLLSMKGIPFYCRDKVENLFENFIAKDILAYLNFAYEIHKTGIGKRSDFLRIMNKPGHFIPRDAVSQETVCEQQLLQYYAEKPYMQLQIQTIFAHYHHIAAMRPYLAIDYVRKSIGYDKWLCEMSKPAELKYYLDKADEIHNTSLTYRTLEEWKAYMADYGEMLRKKESNKPNQGIRLLTMHGSKGLEYHTVFLPGVTAKNIPGRKARLPEQIEEERRIFYVAMTRAKQHLEITYAKEPSFFLSHLATSSYVEQKDGSSVKI